MSDHLPGMADEYDEQDLYGMIPAWVDGDLRPVEKLDVHRRGLRHKAVSVFVNCGDRTLLQKRAKRKYHTPGLWSNSCCTHPRWCEEPAKTARRRLDEELGIAPAALLYQGHVVYRADVGNGLVEHEEVDIFRAELIRPDLPDYNPQEVEAIRWMTYSELEASVATEPHAYTPWLKIYLGQHRDMVMPADRRISATPRR